MSAVNNLLDKYREACSLTSDSAAADSLGIKRQALHQWRKGLSWPSEDHIVEMATKIGDAPEKWLVSVSIDRAPPKARKYWMKLPQAAAGLLLAVGLMPAAHAQIATKAASFESVSSIHYAQLLVPYPAAGWHGPCVAGRPFTARIARMPRRC